MSVKVMGRVWELELPHEEMWVLMALADHADHKGENVFPSVGFIAWKTGYSERHIHRIQARLRERKILIPMGGGNGQPVRYRIDLASCPVKAEYRGAKRKKRDDKMSYLGPDKMSYPGSDIPRGGSDILTGEGLTCSGVGSDISSSTHDKERARINRHEEPSLEPSIEPSRAKAAALPSLKELRWTLADSDDGCYSIEHVIEGFRMATGRVASAADEEAAEMIHQETSFSSRAVAAIICDVKKSRGTRVSSLKYFRGALMDANNACNKALKDSASSMVGAGAEESRKMELRRVRLAYGAWLTLQRPVTNSPAGTNGHEPRPEQELQ